MEGLQTSIYFLAFPCAQRGLPYREAILHSLYRREQVAQTNIELDKHEDILIRDIRGREREFSLEKHGFAISKLSSRMLYRDFSDPEQVI
ncbi:hypothetical protein MMC17_007323, partial [Xylographa soralifera]|nr:hypothetical protein [Xylographa soralifera]